MTRYQLLQLAAIVLAALLTGFEAGRASAAPRPSAETMPPVGDVRSSLAPLTGEVEPPQTTRAPTLRGGLPAETAGVLHAPTVAVSHPPQPAKPVSGIRWGVASWFATGPDGMYAAAGPALRVGHWRGRTVTVCAGRCIRVVLDDWCGCPGGRVIDLSDQAFARLAPLSHGLITVTVR